MPNRSRAAKASGFQREYHYRLLKSDPKWKAAFEEAWAMGCEQLEDTAAERARFGTSDVVMYQGAPCYWKYRKVKDKTTGKIEHIPIGPPITRTVQSDGLLQFLLRGAMPHKYRDQVNVKHSGKIDTGVKKFAGSMEELLALYRKLTSKTAAA
ncbi:MAG: hypothetical protein LAP40_16865 [Acidobacteriia bacterium]|nr:hypothetical protein [Terriglobia bacterium]